MIKNKDVSVKIVFHIFIFNVLLYLAINVKAVTWFTNDVQSVRNVNILLGSLILIIFFTILYKNWSYIFNKKNYVYFLIWVLVWGGGIYCLIFLKVSTIIMLSINIIICTAAFYAFKDSEWYPD